MVLKGLISFPHEHLKKKRPQTGLTVWGLIVGYILHLAEKRVIPDFIININKSIFF
jgi:hypothetical protein